MPALALFAGADAVWAQVITTNTTSYSRTETVTVVTNPTVRLDTFETRITGDLSNGTLLYDQTFPEAFSSATVQGGISAATLAITNAGGPGIVITGPTRVEHTETLIDSTTQTDRVVTDTEESKSFEVVVGPGSIQIGDRGVCTGTGCSGGTGPIVTLTFGETVNNVHTYIHYDITETVTVTEEWLTYEHWALTGVVQAVGVVHTAVQSGALDAGSRFLRRMGDEAAGTQGRGVISVPLLAYGPTGTATVGVDPLGARVWAEAYGGIARTDADGAIPGDERRSYGFAGGVVFSPTEGFTLGVGLDHGRTDIDLDSAFAETGTINLTEIGLSAGYTSGPWFANAALTYGFGNADTTHALGGVSTAGYDLSLWGVLAETGYRFDVGGVRVTPTIGIDYLDMRTDGFTETGGAALVAPDHAIDRTRAWIGLDLGHTWHTPSGGSFALSGYGRLVGVLSGDERTLPVAFASVPGAGMTVTGNAEDRFGFDAGAAAGYAFGNGASLFAAYDARFRDGFTAHQGRIGLKVTW